MPHPLFFVEKPGSKIRARSSRGMPGPSSATAITAAIVGSRDGRQTDVSAAPGQRVDGILGQHLDRPLEEHGVAVDARQVGLDGRIDHHSVRERGHACPEVPRDPLDDRPDVHWLELRLATNPLEAMRHAIESLEIAPHVRHGGVRAVVRSPLFHQLDPPTQARERRAELVRRLARHAGPQTLARRVVARVRDDVDSRR